MSKPRITALDIEKKEFSSSLKGYNTAEVRAFLERVAAEIEILERETRVLKERLAVAEADRNRFVEIENQVKDAIIVAQAAADEVRANARKEAELILREAEVSRLQVVAEIERLGSEKAAFVAQIKSFLDAFYEKLRAPEHAVVAIEEKTTASG
jgi:cell division initiation protein